LGIVYKNKFGLQDLCGFGGDNNNKKCQKWAEKGPQKRGLGGRQVGAFSVFRPGDTGIPFIFWPKSAFFHKIVRF